MNPQKLALLARDNRAAQVFFAAYSTGRRSFQETDLHEVINLSRRANIGLFLSTSGPSVRLAWAF